MAEGFRHQRGGILGLYRLLEEHGEAVEYDLLTNHYRLDDLGTPALSWRDLWVLVRRWQKDPHTALCEALHGVRWDVTAQLLAVVADTLAAGNWQRAGKKTAPKPKPIERPWTKTKTQALGSAPIPINEFDDWWEANAPAA